MRKFWILYGADYKTRDGRDSRRDSKNRKVVDMISNRVSTDLDCWVGLDRVTLECCIDGCQLGLNCYNGLLLLPPLLLLLPLPPGSWNSNHISSECRFNSPNQSANRTNQTVNSYKNDWTLWNRRLGFSFGCDAGLSGQSSVKLATSSIGHCRFGGMGMLLVTMSLKSQGSNYPFFGPSFEWRRSAIVSVCVCVCVCVCCQSKWWPPVIDEWWQQ